jgi:hypothetical protein
VEELLWLSVRARGEINKKYKDLGFGPQTRQPFKNIIIIIIIIPKCAGR